MPAFALACGHARTAEVAEDVLRNGGNAVDAAVAAALMATVAEPVLAGLLGGGFAMVTDARNTKLLDFFVHTPKQKTRDTDFRAVNADFGTTLQEFHIGAASVATPGIGPGLWELHERAGRIGFRDLAAPAITAARDGVIVTGFQARLGQIVAPILEASPEARRIMCDEKGPLPEGAVYRNRDYADVLEVFALEGARFLTEGEVAQALADLASQGGHLTASDLRSYRPVWRPPLNIERHGHRIALNPGPSLGGPLIALSLRLAGKEPSPLKIAETFRTVSKARALANDDPAGLLSDALVEELRTGVRHPASTRGTTQISIVDGEGLGVALTMSNGEGCGLIVPGTGIMANNMLGEDDLVPGDWHGWPVDTRLASMMCPLAIRGPERALTMMGSGGSNRIRTALTQVLLHLIDRGRPLEAAIESPRLHVEGDKLDFEETGLSEFDRTALMEAFPEATLWPEPSMFFGGVHAARVDRRGASAAGDPRRAGVAISG